MDSQDVGPLTISAGIYHGHEHVYVTHRQTGKQWISKDSREGGTATIGGTVDLLQIDALKFDPTKVVGSCDTRFWILALPSARSEFDALVFIGG
jgi:hypothetical protein